MSSSNLLRIKTPSQLTSSDSSRRTRARSRTYLKKSEDSSMDTSPSLNSTPEPISDIVTALWLSTHSSLDSSSGSGRTRYRKEVSFSDLRHRQDSAQRRVVSSTPKHPPMTRATRSAPNLASKWSTQPNLSSETPISWKKTSKSANGKQMDEEVQSSDDRSVNLKRSSASHKKLNQRKMLLKGLSSFGSCFVGENSDLENSFEEFRRSRNSIRSNQTDSETSAACITRKHVSNDIDITRRPVSKLPTNPKSSGRTSKNSQTSSVLKHNQSAACRCHIQKLSFDYDSEDSVEETRPLDQSMNEFIKCADLENLSSIMDFYDKVVNKSRAKCTAV